MPREPDRTIQPMCPIREIAIVDGERSPGSRSGRSRAMYAGMTRLAGLAGAGAAAGVLALSGSASAAVGGPAGHAGESAVTGTVTSVIKPARSVRVPAAKGTAAGAAVSAPAAATVPITGQYQRTDYWCVPASSSVSLATLGARVGQKRLAKQMKTTKASGGTTFEDAMPVLDTYAAKHGYDYDWTDVSTGAKVLNAVAYDTGTLRKATVIGVWWKKLPWNKGLSNGTDVGHFVAVYGYDRAAKTIKVWDPWKATGGRHTLTATALSHAAQEHGLAYITKR